MSFPSGRFAETLGHVREGLVCLEKMVRLGVDQGDAARHVRQDFLVENDFALDPAGCFRLAAGHFSGEPGGDGRHDNQPEGGDRDLIQ